MFKFAFLSFVLKWKSPLGEMSGGDGFVPDKDSIPQLLFLTKNVVDFLFYELVRRKLLYKPVNIRQLYINIVFLHF